MLWGWIDGVVVFSDILYLVMYQTTVCTTYITPDPRIDHCILGLAAAIIAATGHDQGVSPSVVHAI